MVFFRDQSFKKSLRSNCYNICFSFSLHFDGGYVVTLAIVSQKMVSIPVNLGGLEVFTLSDVEEADLPYCRTKR